MTSYNDADVLYTVTHRQESVDVENLGKSLTTYETPKTLGYSVQIIEL